MFNKKLLSAFAYVVAVLLALQALYYLVMFTWSYMAPLPDMTFLMQPMEMLAVLGQIMFVYLALAALKNLSTCSCNFSVAESAKKALEGPVKTLKRVARKTTKKKK